MRNDNSSRQWLIRIITSFAFIVLGRPCLAQSTSVWSGLGSNNLWSTPNNWQSNTVPVSSSSTAIVMTGTSQNILVQNAGGFTLNSLTFASEAGPFTIQQSAADFFTFLPTPQGVPAHIDQFSANSQSIFFPNTGLQLSGDLLLGGTGSGTLNITGQLIGSGTPRLILNGPYTVSLTTSVANTISGIVVNAGTLRVAGDIALGTNAPVLNGGALQLSSNLAINHSLVAGAGGGTIDVNGFSATMANTALTVTGPGRLTFTNSTGTGAANISAQLQQTGGLTVTGANNTVTLTGANTYSGGTTISGAAVLSIDSDARLGAAGGGTSFDGGALRITSGSGYNTSRNVTLNSGGGTFDIQSAGAAVGLSGVVSGSGGLTKIGAGRLGLLQANTYTGTTNVVAGELDIVHNQAVANSTVNLSGGTLGFFSPATAPVLGGLSGTGNLSFSGLPGGLSVGNNNASTTYSGNLSGALSNGLTKLGTGVWTLSGSNTYTGPFNIQSGAVVVGSAGALSPNSTINLSGGATLDLNGFNFSPAAGTSSLGGTVLLRFGAISAVPGVTVAYSGANVSNGFLSGVGQQVLNGANTFNNVTTFNGTQLVQSGTLNLANSTIGGALSAGGTLNWNNGSLTSSGNLTVSNTSNFTAVTSNGRINVSGGVNAGTLNVTGTSLVLGGGSTTFIGSISEPGGTINLNGQSIDLRGGLLVNNGTIANGTTIVGFGALAKGAGTYGPVNVTDGGKFSPGNSPGTATTGATTWNSGGSYLVEIADALAGAGVGWDIWNVQGPLSLNATPTANGRFTVALSTMDALAANFDSHRDYDWTILHASDGIGGFDPSEIFIDTSAFRNDLAGGHFSIIENQNDLVAHFASAVPEPTLTCMLLVSLGLLGLRRKYVG
jgi:fibronectin-binding autotransporter adhesin